MSKGNVRDVANELKLYAKTHRTGWKYLSEAEAYATVKTFMRMGMYDRVGDGLTSWLQCNESERLSKMLENLKKSVRIKKRKGKLYKSQHGVLGPFDCKPDKVVGTDVTTYDEYGNPIEYIEREGLKLEDYWRREYKYQNGVICHYIEYDKSGNWTKEYNAVIDDNGRLESSETKYNGHKYVETWKYEYDRDGLLVREKKYIDGKESETNAYAYDDLDRLVKHQRWQSDYSHCETFEYKYTRHSTKVIMEYSKGNGTEYKQVKFGDFMNNINFVDRLVHRSDTGWRSDGYHREYVNVYVKK